MGDHGGPETADTETQPKRRVRGPEMQPRRRHGSPDERSWEISKAAKARTRETEEAAIQDTDLACTGSLGEQQTTEAAEAWI